MRTSLSSKSASLEVSLANLPLSLRAQNLVVRAGSTTILEGVDFRGQTGQLIGVLGPSGSGKSTLLYALSGFRPATSGTVHFGSHDLYKQFEQLKTQIGLVPQDDVVPTLLSVERVLKYASELRLPHFNRDARESRVRGVLHKLGLSERANLKVARLSGGQRKRVSVAVELLTRPNVLFADEPTSGLDPALEQSLMAMLKDMAEEGRLVVVTTHIMSSLLTLDAVCVLYRGHLIYFGPPSQLKAYFGVDDFTGIYHAMEKRPAADWKRRFDASSLRRDFL